MVEVCWRRHCTSPSSTLTGEPEVIWPFLGSHRLGRPILELYGYLEAFAAFQTRYNEWGAWIVFGAGLTPFQALVAATRAPGHHLATQVDRSLPPLGVVAVGARADLVLLDGNPLEDIRNTRAIAGVVMNGTFFDRTALDDLLNPKRRQRR